MNTFKVGDKVRLNHIMSKDYSHGAWDFLKPWANPRLVYNVIRVDGDYIFVQETAHIGPGGYHHANFEPLDGPTILGDQLLMFNEESQ